MQIPFSSIVLFSGSPVQTVIAKDTKRTLEVHSIGDAKETSTNHWMEFFHEPKEFGCRRFLMQAEGDLYVRFTLAERVDIGVDGVLSGWSSTLGNSPSSYGGVSVFEESENILMTTSININPSKRGKVALQSGFEGLF